MNHTMGLIILLYLINVDGKIRIYVTDDPLEQIGGKFYKKELLTNQYNEPKELSYNTLTRNLFFTYMDDKIQNSGRAYINVISKESKKIEGIERNKATAVDLFTGEVYFGSDNGLYKYNPDTNKAYYKGLYNVNIMKLVVRNHDIFLIDANNHMLYKAINNGQSVVKIGNWISVVEFDVDRKNNIHLVTLCGVYCFNGTETVKNKDLPVVYHFLIKDENTFGVTEDAIYDINCSDGKATKFADLDFFPRSIIYGDNGDLYYSMDDNIYRLRPISSYLVYLVNGVHTT